MLAAEHAGLGALTWTRFSGVALAPDRATAVRWFTAAHFKDLPWLTTDPEVMGAVHDFVDGWTNADGSVALPSGVHLIDFHRGVVVPVPSTRTHSANAPREIPRSCWI